MTEPERRLYQDAYAIAAIAFRMQPRTSKKDMRLNGDPLAEVLMVECIVSAAERYAAAHPAGEQTEEKK